MSIEEEGRSTAQVTDKAADADAPARADARRNRGRILEAAEEAFADEGLSVPVDEIARRAGVGPGTVYRNFPTKEALFEAVIRHHLETLVGEARELATSDRPAEALFTFLEHLSRQAGARRNLIEAMTGAGLQLEETLADVKGELAAAIQDLLQRAQHTGEVRTDVTVEDLFGMVVGCAMSRGTDAVSQTRMLSVVCEGLKT